VHISNNAFDLEPVVASAAAELGWSGASRLGGGNDDGASSSHWVVISPSNDTVDAVVGDGWKPLEGDPVTWTDDYSSVLSVLK
jgi:hypothetical protein